MLPGNCMWYQESVTFSVGATRTLEALVGRRAAAARAASALGDDAVGVERHVRAVLLGRADRAAGRRRRRPRCRSSTSCQVIRSIRCSVISSVIFTECQTPCNTRPSPKEAGWESTVAVRDVNLWHEITGRRRAGRPDPRRRLRALQLRAGDTGAREALHGDRLRHARLRAVRPAGTALRHGGLGRRRRRPARRARARDRPRPRHLDGRDDRDRLRRQVPGADDLGRDQLRGREARSVRTARSSRTGSTSPASIRTVRAAGSSRNWSPGRRCRKRFWRPRTASRRSTPSSRSCATRTRSRSSRPHARRCATWTSPAGCRRSPRRRSCSAATRT